MRNFEVEAMGMGTNSGYTGAFTKPIDNLIRGLVSGRVLHLFSGSSMIGQERIDMSHHNATVNCDIRQFIENDDRDWDWVVLDPPYAIIRAKTK